MWKPFLLILIIALSHTACDNPAEANSAPQDIESTTFRLLEASGIDFINQVEDQEDFNVLTYRNYYNGGGVAIGDVNNDGLADVYFTANMTPNKLYINKGNFQFEEISDQAGVSGNMAWSTGVSMADINGDGFLDIYVCNSGDAKGDNKTNELFINNGDLTFTESASTYGLDDQGFSTHASFFDFDKDGDLDMYLVNNSFKDPSKIDFKNVRNERDYAGGDKLLRNDNGKYVDISEQAGIYGSKIGYGLGVSVSDLDGDNWQDIYISNDFWERDYLYINQKDGTFKEDLTERISMTSTASMGADIADLDNNGTYDIFSTDMLPSTNKRIKQTTIFNDYNLEDLKYRNDYHYQYTQNCLQLNNGDGHFREAANITGVNATDWSWAALMFDFDNDGLKDIFVSNGVYHDITDMDFSDFLEDEVAVGSIIKEKGRFDFKDFLEFLPSNKLSNYAFVNQGNLTFVNKAQGLGLGQPSFSNGSAYGDLDNDGDLDLIVNNVNMPAFVYQNESETSGNNYIQLTFESASQNRFGLGAKVELKTDGQTYHAQNLQSRGFQSSTEPKLTIGLGSAENIDSLMITWPNGKCQVMTNVQVNQLIELKDQEAQSCPQPIRKNKGIEALTEILASSKSIHKENLFNDFNYENLLPHMLSTEGPEVLIGDLNNDNLQDYILLGAQGDNDKVFLQKNSAEFAYQEQPSLDATSAYESTCGLLIDIDRDSDLDLVIGSGGNNPTTPTENYLLRIFLNDGQGIFERASISAFRVVGNLSVIEELDLGDNKRGIFFGARAVPGNYGLTPRNFLFTEENGQWRDVTTQETGSIGLITDALAIDLDNDNDDDLVVAGEWMPINIFKNNNGKLELAGAVPNSHGLWQTLEKTDVDKDGKLDIVAGNWGDNSKLQATEERPLMMYVQDFDDNKKTENIITWFAPEDKTASLFASKNDLTKQLPGLKKAVLKNRDYAQASITNLLDKDKLDKSQKLLATELSSAVFINKGDFRFETSLLPFAAQLSPIFSIKSIDLNNDGYEDLCIGGNMFGLKPEIGRLNSSDGLFLINLKGAGFEEWSTSKQKPRIPGEIRDIESIQLSDNSSALIFGINNSATRIFKLN